ncbi:MAG: sigma 54-interacting transcriptional regulator [Deltaproteobacteria bacterium]|nr:sigma 54-interacting transcriptional regulator [Deltaproteobacteria bacterium]
MAPNSPSLPLTQLLGELSQPALLVTQRGEVSWGNERFAALFKPEAPPPSLDEWQRRSPPSPGSCWEELRQRGRALWKLAVANGIGIFQLALVPDPGGGGVILCTSTSTHRDLKELGERTTVLEAIFHSLNEGVLALDSSERITAFSLSAERITGFPEEEVIGKLCREVFQAPAGTQCPFETMINQGQGFHQREMEVRGKGGRRLHVAVNATLVRDPEGGVEGAVVVLRDLAEIDRLREELGTEEGFHGIIGHHPSIQRVIDRVETVAPSDVSILILGESGTGKELVARAIHELSTRRRGPFLKVNCAALADTLLESELFGHVRGAFTGAVRDRPGRFEAADGGTLFLDEIGDTSASLQAKLLRVLQEGEYERVGETKTRKADVRVLAATNKDLRAAVAAGQFREDLFYRLCVVPIQLPPLRDRKEDIPILSEHFVKRLSLKGGAAKTLAPTVYPVLKAYDWPGNVRELENALAHACVCAPGNPIPPEALPEHVLLGVPAIPRGPSLPAPAPKEADEASVRSALEECRWNKGRAAQRLGLSRTTLWRRMRDLGIQPPRP